MFTKSKTEYLEKLEQIDGFLKLGGAVLLVGVFLTLIIFGPRAQENKVPKLTPEDQIEINNLNQEMESIRKEMDEIRRLLRLQQEGKLWSA